MRHLRHLILSAMALGCAGVLAPAATLANPVAAACAPMAERKDVRGLWVGHFSGGNVLYDGVQKRVNWRNEYRCFTAARACHAWRADMRRVWRDVRGYGTCIALRGGGRPIRPSHGALRTRY
ncbi:MAG: hypothetical protein FJX29_07285 [Alphaproteobacteria bacterium]|nr:hypothetical protein [Alphaproteobacteria bacterium]